MGKKNKHDRTIDELEELVKGKYQMVLKNVNYTTPRHCNILGELDLVGIRNDNWDIYEVKTYNGLDKAREQLQRAREHLQGCGNIRAFYYSSETGKVEQIY
jgi:hypothetical protein